MNIYFAIIFTTYIKNTFRYTTYVGLLNTGSVVMETILRSTDVVATVEPPSS